MQGNARTLPSHAHPLALHRFCRCSRSVLARVLDGGREVDSLQASSPEALRAALRPVYRHLPRGSGSIEFTAIEETRFLLGMKQVRREVVLSGLDAALAFLVS